MWPRYNYLKIMNLRVQKKTKKNPNIEKIAFKVVQMKFFAMYITHNISFDIFMVSHLQNIFIEQDLYLIS